MLFEKRFDLLFWVGIPFLSTLTFALSEGQPVFVVLQARSSAAVAKIKKNLVFNIENILDSNEKRG
jgi:hypothetical protein